MTPWTDLPLETRDWMDFLGEFGPTVAPEDRTIKGAMRNEEGDCCHVYLSSHDLREFARACEGVADWLDTRSSQGGKS